MYFSILLFTTLHRIIIIEFLFSALFPWDFPLWCCFLFFVQFKCIPLIKTNWSKRMMCLWVCCLFFQFLCSLPCWVFFSADICDKTKEICKTVILLFLHLIAIYFYSLLHCWIFSLWSIYYMFILVLSNFVIFFSVSFRINFFFHCNYKQFNILFIIFFFIFTVAHLSIDSKKQTYYRYRHRVYKWHRVHSVQFYSIWKKLHVFFSIFIIIVDY